MRSWCLTDTDLHEVEDALQSAQRRNFYQLKARAVHRGHYYHAYCMRIDVERDSGSDQDMGAGDEQMIIDALRGLADWLYDKLEREFDYLTTNAAVDETIVANGWRFEADGRHYD